MAAYGNRAVVAACRRGKVEFSLVMTKNSGAHAVACGATLRRRIITVPARLARPARTPVLHLPSRRPWAPA